MRTPIQLASVLILVLALLPFSAHAREWAPWCNMDNVKGWHFYCDEAEEKTPVPKVIMPEALAPQAAAPSLPVEPMAVEQLEVLQASVQESRAKAVLNPTEANVEDYIRRQAKLLVMGGSFADTWQRVVWQNGDLFSMAIEIAKKISSERFKIFGKALMESKLHGSSFFGGRR